MALRTVLVEDESASRDRLRRLLERHGGDVVIVAEADNGVAAVQVINEYEPDLVLLDISLPGLDGFGVLGALAVRPAIVFATAYDEHAVRAFRENAVDYLLKPIEAEHLSSALHKVKSARSPQVAGHWAEVIAALRKAREPELRRIACRIGDSTVFVRLEEVQFFRADQGYTLVKCGPKELLIDTTLAELEVRLDPADFVRVHRNTLVNMNHVNCLKRQFDGRIKIVLNSGDELSSSRRYADNLRNLA